MQLGTLGTGPGRAFKDGSLGGQMQTGPGRQFRDGALGVQVYRPGRLKPRYEPLRRNRRTMAGLGLIRLSSELLIGLTAGAGLTWWVLRKK